MRPLLAALALLLPLTACSSGGGSDAAAPAGTPTTQPTSSPAAPWNPCVDLSAARVGRLLGAAVTKETGTADTMRCAFLPVKKGGPTLNVTYLTFAGDFDRAFKAMGTIEGTVRDLRIAGATTARLVVHTTPGAAGVTGFVQVGRLIETVNALALAPYDASAVVAATRDVMTTLVAHAPASQTHPGGV